MPLPIQAQSGLAQPLPVEVAAVRLAERLQFLRPSGPKPELPSALPQAARSEASAVVPMDLQVARLLDSTLDLLQYSSPTGQLLAVLQPDLEVALSLDLLAELLPLLTLELRRHHRASSEG